MKEYRFLIFDWLRLLNNILTNSLFISLSEFIRDRLFLINNLKIIKLSIYKLVVFLLNFFINFFWTNIYVIFLFWGFLWTRYSRRLWGFVFFNFRDFMTLLSNLNFFFFNTGLILIKINFKVALRILILLILNNLWSDRGFAQFLRFWLRWFLKSNFLLSLMFLLSFV